MRDTLKVSAISATVYLRLPSSPFSEVGEHLGYARCSTDVQDPTAPHDALTARAPSPDARDIAGELTETGVNLSTSGSVHDPDDPDGRLLFNILAMIAGFESHLIRHKGRQGQGPAARQAAQTGTSAGYPLASRQVSGQPSPWSLSVPGKFPV